MNYQYKNKNKKKNTGKTTITNKPNKMMKITEKQLSMIVAERSRAVEKGELFCWDKMAKILNTEGPIIKKAVKWQNVSLKF